MQNNVLDQRPGGAQPDGSDGQGLMRSVSLRDLWAPIYRSRFAILAIFVAVFGFAILATLLIQPQYRAVATIEIKAEAQKVLGTEDPNETGPATDAQMFLETQLDIIRSRSTATAVAQSLGLYNNDNFLEAMGVDVGDRPATASGQEARRKQVNQVLMNHLRVEFLANTRIAEIRFTSADPLIAQRVANSYADNYIRLNLARRFDASSYSLDFLRDQLREAQTRLANSERQAIAYARASRLVDASNAAGSSAAGAPQSLTTASLVSLNQSLSEAVARRIAAEQRWNAARGARVASIPEVTANPTVQALQQQRALLSSQYQQELQTRTESYPTVRQLLARLNELDRQIASIAGNVRNTIRGEFETAQAQEASLRNTIAQLTNTTLDEQNRGVQLSILRREVNTNRQQLDALLTRYNEINAQAGVQTNNLSVIDHADLPDGPYWPSVPLNIALAIVGAVLLSAIYVIGRENLFVVIRTPEDVVNRLQLPVLGTVPAADQVMMQFSDPKSNVSESFNTIRTSLSLSSRSGVPHALMVTSTQEGEGKSTICYGLAQGLAKLGRSVVIIDADLRRPNVHNLFGLSNTEGASNILSGSRTIDDVIQRDAGPNIDIIPAGPIPPDASELLAAGALLAVIQTLKARYDHVLVDSAPVLGLADAPLVGNSVDGMVYVIETARTSVRAVQNALTRLQQADTPLVGVVLSRFDASKAGYGYDYQYAYDYTYGTAKKT